ncbi:MAG: hypothetical protein MK171_00995 [Pirellulales bacterium]|nr:hypothetical protein [Pirellulales bacterium]
MRLISLLYFNCWSLAIVLVLFAIGSARAEDLLDSAGPQFAPGVLTTIPPDLDRADTLSVHDMIEVRANADLQREPFTTTESRTLYEMAKSVHFRRDIWCLELAFKPLRMTHVDLPRASGKVERKLIWYMVYRVRNSGVGLGPEQQDDGTFKTAHRAHDPLRFVPQFLLMSQDRDRQGERIGKTYLDRILPAAIETIRRRELPSGRLLSSVQMSEAVLGLEGSRAVGGAWGVATWVDIDPEIDFFSVLVGGLTNANQWQDPPGQFRLGDPPGNGRRLSHKKLQLNFWRPGDTYAENEQEIRYGPAPGKAHLYGSGEGVAYQWVYR